MHRSQRLGYGHTWGNVIHPTVPTASPLAPAGLAGWPPWGGDVLSQLPHFCQSQVAERRAAAMKVTFDCKLWSHGYGSRTSISLRTISWGAAAGFHLLEWSCHILSTSSWTSYLIWEAAGTVLACIHVQVELFLPEKIENRHLVSIVSCISSFLEKREEGKEVGARPFQGARGRRPSNAVLAKRNKYTSITITSSTTIFNTHWHRVLNTLHDHLFFVVVEVILIYRWTTL